MNKTYWEFQQSVFEPNVFLVQQIYLEGFA